MRMPFHLRSLMAIAIVGLAGLGTQALARAKTVTTLDRGEPFEAMTFHAGMLWVGKSRLNFNANYSVEAYTGGHELIGTVTLPHSATFLYPYSATQVLAFGTGFDPNLTRYSLIELQNGALRATTVRIPMEAWGNLWLGTVGGREYFTDMGGNYDDPDRDTDPTLASQTIFSMGRGAPRYLSSRVRMPTSGMSLGGMLYVIHGQAMGDSRTNLVQVNPANGTVKSLYSTFRNGLSRIIKVGSTPYLAVSEMGSGLINFLDSRTGQPVGEAQGVSSPRSLATFGHCVLAADPWTNVVTVVDVEGLGTGSNPPVVGQLDVGLSTDEFRALRNIVVDPETGLVYARSNFACNPMTDACDKDYNRVVALDPEVTGPLLEQCR